MAIDVGVVVGRFQVADLSDGHVFLIDHAREKHRTVVVAIGSSQEWGTAKNPLNYACRERTIRDRYPDVICVPLPDMPGNDKRWSHHLDVTIRSLGWELGEVVLYAGRDSFKPHYVGDFKVEEIDSGMDHISGTAVRHNIGKLILPTIDFRRGVIYATQNPPSLNTMASMYQKAAAAEKRDPHEVLTTIDIAEDPRR